MVKTFEAEVMRIQAYYNGMLAGIKMLAAGEIELRGAEKEIRLREAEVIYNLADVRTRHLLAVPASPPSEADRGRPRKG